MLPIMATAKKKFVAIRQKLDFSDHREKKQNSIRFSLSRARVPKLRVSTVIIKLFKILISHYLA
jgi:hypothetical protein